MIEFLNHYGFLALLLVMIIVGGHRFVRAWNEVRKIDERALSVAALHGSTAWPEKPKRKRKPLTPEQRLHETLTAIAETEQRPHVLIGDDVEVVQTASDAAQMRDLAWQEYLRECQVRRLRETARPIPIIQLSAVDDFRDHYSDYVTDVSRYDKHRGGRS